MAIFVDSIGDVSPQNLPQNLQDFNPVNYSTDRLQVIEPAVEDWLDVRASRRMSRLLKMSAVAGLKALKTSGVGNPDGIITGTSYGCLADTAAFVHNMISNNETALNPTPFIQSTHNTIGSQLSILLKCTGYNETFTQRTFSFEHALLSTRLVLNENSEQKYLVGAADEVTDESFAIMKRMGKLQSTPGESLQLIDKPDKGTIPGEGSTYFVLGGKKNNQSIAQITDLATFYNPANIEERVKKFLAENGPLPDLVLLGKNGDQDSDASIEQLREVACKDKPVGYFKHLCGEYPTATAFAMSLACKIVKQQIVPAIISPEFSSHACRRILIYNQYLDRYHSLILIDHADL